MAEITNDVKADVNQKGTLQEGIYTKPRFNPKKAVSIDFDGVIHSYEHGWQDGSIYGKLADGFAHFLFNLMLTNPVFICSTRNSEQIWEWLRKNLFINTEAFCSIEVITPETFFWEEQYVLGITDRKLPAILYIDDRAYRYDWYGNSSWYDVHRTVLRLNDEPTKKQEHMPFGIGVPDNQALPSAVRTIVEELKKDKSPGSYYYTWQANIAQCIESALCSEYLHNFSGDDKMRRAINEGAKNFLDLLINIKE